MKTTMPAHIALYLIDAMLAAASTESYTPVINSARFTSEGAALRALATDRYRIHEVTTVHARTTARASESVIISAAMLKHIKRAITVLAPRRTDRADTTVTIKTRKTDDLDTRITTTVQRGTEDSITLAGLAVRGNYPPIDKLIDKAEAAERYNGRLRLNPAFLGKLEKLNPGQHPAAEFKPTVSYDPAKPGPVYLTFDGEGIQARALIMPNLVLS